MSEMEQTSYPSFEKLTLDRYSGRIANKIQALIVASKLMPGDRLPTERELAEQFGVSRTAVREALKMLEERALVRVQRGRGAFITTHCLDAVTASIGVASQMRNGTMGNLLEARRWLEERIVTLAVERATPEDLARMEAVIETMKNVPRVSEEFVAADLEFHTALASATQNPFFLILSLSLAELLQKARRIALGVPALSDGGIGHRRILECIRNKDAALARKAILEHTDHFERELQEAGVDSSAVMLLDDVSNGRD